jgi:hypothetical protein
MSRSETLEAFEEGLITETEALEQAMVDNVEALYERAAVERIDSVAATMRQAALTPLPFHL